MLACPKTAQVMLDLRKLHITVPSPATLGAHAGEHREKVSGGGAPGRLATRGVGG
jgi:hypothetical protein